MHPTKNDLPEARAHRAPDRHLERAFSRNRRRSLGAGYDSFSGSTLRYPSLPEVAHRENINDVKTVAYSAIRTSDPKRIRVLCVDNHPLLREGIATIINNQPDMLLVAEATNGTEGIEKFRKHRPDVTLMDLRLPDMSGVDSFIAIRADFPEARIVMPI